MSNQDKKILIVDLETTGFLKNGGKIIEIGIVELDLNSGDAAIIFDEMTHEKGITKQEVENSWIVKNSNITVESVRLSRSLDLMKGEIQDIINSYPLGITAYNNQFDFSFLEDRDFVLNKKLGCPMLLSTNLLKIKNNYGGYKWPTAQEAYDHFVPDNDYVETHRGADDALHEATIVYELFKTGAFKL